MLAPTDEEVAAVVDAPWEHDGLEDGPTRPHRPSDEQLRELRAAAYTERRWRCFRDPRWAR